MLFYSKTTNGFYDDSIHAIESIPADRVTISREDHRLMMDGQAAGRTWQAQTDGRPALADRPLPTPDERRAILAGHAQRALAKTDLAILRAYEQGRPVPAPLADYREALRDVVRGKSTVLPTL